MEYLDIEERPGLAEAQVSKPANIVEVGEDGNLPFYIAISQSLDNEVDDQREAKKKAEDVQQRRAAMKVADS